MGEKSATSRAKEERRATEELPSALHALPDLHSEPPVCLRFPPGGERMVAVVLGARKESYVAGILRSLHLDASITVSSSVEAYNASLARLARVIGKTVPGRFRSIGVGEERIPILVGLRPGLIYDPVCPTVLVEVRAHGTPNAEELAWARHVVSQYGADLVSIFYGAVVEED